MEQSYINKIRTHIDCKKLYRYFVLRKYLLSLNISGLYTVADLQKCAIATKLNINTLRQNLRSFEEKGLLIKRCGYIVLKSLTGTNKSYYRIFINNEAQINEQKNPSIFFSDLIKERLLWKNVLTQAKMEARKCEDPRNGKKLMKLVGSSKAQINDKLGIYLSHSTIGKILGRTKTTAYGYIKRLNESKILKVIKNSQFVCDAGDFIQCRESLNLFGRTFIKDGKVYERKQNTYIFSV